LNLDGQADGSSLNLLAAAVHCSTAAEGEEDGEEEDGDGAAGANSVRTEPKHSGMLHHLPQQYIDHTAAAAAAPAAPRIQAVGDVCTSLTVESLEQQLLAALPNLSETVALLRKAAGQLQAHLQAQRLLRGEAAARAAQLPGACQLAGVNAGARLGWLCEGGIPCCLVRLSPCPGRGQAKGVACHLAATLTQLCFCRSCLLLQRWRSCAPPLC